MHPLDRRSRTAQRARALVIATETHCHICHEPVDKSLPYRNPATGRIDPRSKSIDAIIPFSAGGSHTDLNNLRLAHLGCNCARHDDPLVTHNRRSDNW